VDLLYQVSSVQKIFPYLNGTPQLQPYAFAATATITNMGFSEVQNWAMGIHFQHNEVSPNRSPQHPICKEKDE
jgi:hypothetical protein